MVVLRSAPSSYQSGDLVHLETPNNPTGVATCIATLSTKVHSAGALLCVDSTFAPPPLQKPFLHGADYVLHSASKYLGGHSDLLGGVLAVKSESEARTLLYERTFLGSVMGSLEGWLELRSLRTLSLRVERASTNATTLARWLHSLLPHSVVRSVTHASLQPQDPWLATQMPNGYGPVFSLTLHTEEMAQSLPSRLQVFRHATSLGGVESLVEWRALSDSSCDRRLIRVSVGVEAWGDLKGDLERGISEVEGLLAGEKQSQTGVE
jgi:cystathionine beta-lyase/cystathionine gamma-synthase